MISGFIYINNKTKSIDMQCGKNWIKGLKPGKKIEVMKNGEWIKTEIAYDNGFYLTNIPVEDISGLLVRISI